MQALSISRAWEETRSIIATDGRLLGSVALAFLVLPAAIIGLIVPGGVGAAIFATFETTSPWALALVIVVLLCMLVGQLAIARLTLVRPESVGGSIVLALRRLPTYIVIALLVGFALMLLLFALVMAIVAMSGNVSEQEFAKSPVAAVAVLAMTGVYLFLLTRIVALAGAVAVSEPIGPFSIIRRTWQLTSGNSWRLFGFLILFMVVSGVVLFAISAATGVVVQLLFGAEQPMSASALIAALIDGLANGLMMLFLTVMLARIYVQLAGRDEAQASVPNSGI